jgi:hypothetical protein
VSTPHKNPAKEIRATREAHWHTAPAGTFIMLRNVLLAFGCLTALAAQAQPPYPANGASAKQGIRAHDQFNLVKATLTLRQKVTP